MRSLEWAVVSFWKGERGRQAHTENTMWRWRQRWGRCIHKPRTAGRRLEAGGGMGQIRPHSLAKEPTLHTPWPHTSSLLSCETTHFCCLRHSVCVYRSPKKQIQGKIRQQTDSPFKKGDKPWEICSMTQTWPNSFPEVHSLMAPPDKVTSDAVLSYVFEKGA